MPITLVAAIAANGVIGRDGTIPWHLPGDLAHFKKLTLGHVLVMGRRTYESIGRPLPGRTTVVVTRQPDWCADSVIACTSIDEALDRATAVSDAVFVVGGGEVYSAAMPRATHMVVTLVDGDVDGDTYFPSIDWSGWQEDKRVRGDGYSIAYSHRVSETADEQRSMPTEEKRT